jgi:UDP-N-acetylmuramate: L-alanyl-gamma-D-glutamyl-meso-diaminopimelate ligase
MHNLALALHNKGYHVTGVMMLFFEPSKSLKKRNFTVLGWYPEKITNDIEAVI